jgi:hypothetical protein
MKRLFTSSDLIQVNQLRDMLESEGIACVIKNEILGGLAPEVPFTETFPELWIQNDSDLTRANMIKADWKRPAEIAGGLWNCPNCGEQLDPQFSSCWKCGTAKAADSAVA